jgi:molybdate transport system substrate-binding protein
MQKTHHFMRASDSGRVGRRRFAAHLLSLGAGALVATAASAAAPPVRVAAASDLKFALAELAAGYERDTGGPVQVNLGSSGQFVQQIRQGLPVDLFMAADERYVFQLADAGLTQGRGTVYAVGRIALIVPTASPLVLDPALRSLRAALPTMRSFAIANPDHAPYGRAARQALQRLGLWQQVAPKLVLGENIAQATQFVASGSAAAGITALSLALAPEVAALTRSLPLPGDLHETLRQRMVLLRGARPEAARFYAYLQGEAARAVFRRYGFTAG